MISRFARRKVRPGETELDGLQKMIRRTHLSDLGARPVLRLDVFGALAWFAAVTLAAFALVGLAAGLAPVAAQPQKDQGFQTLRRTPS